MESKKERQIDREGQGKYIKIVVLESRRQKYSGAVTAEDCVPFVKDLTNCISYNCLSNQITSMEKRECRVFKIRVHFKVPSCYPCRISKCVEVLKEFQFVFCYCCELFFPFEAQMQSN